MGAKNAAPTPLWQKLGLKEGRRLFVGAAPQPPAGPDIRDVVDAYPPVRTPREADVHLFFTTSREVLAKRFGRMASTLPPDGGLWIAWPKKASRIEHDLSFQVVQRIGLEAGLVDNKSCSIDDDWQALRFVYRLEDRPRA